MGGREAPEEEKFGPLGFPTVNSTEKVNVTSGDSGDL